MLAWLTNHWIGVACGAALVGYIAWWIAKPFTWRDAETRGGSIDNAASFKS